MFSNGFYNYMGLHNDANPRQDIAQHIKRTVWLASQSSDLP
jgi:hypothetical protein